jgi:hypothetical protein
MAPKGERGMGEDSRISAHRHASDSAPHTHDSPRRNGIDHDTRQCLHMQMHKGKALSWVAQRGEGSGREERREAYLLGCLYQYIDFFSSHWVNQWSYHAMVSARL